MRLGGIMNYVELDMNNLAAGCRAGAPSRRSGTNARNENGFIVYFSDRRNNRNNGRERDRRIRDRGRRSPADVDTPTAPSTRARTSTETAVENYGGARRNVPSCSPLGLPVLPSLAVCVPTPSTTTRGRGRSIPDVGGDTSAARANERALLARANRNAHFRRALKLTTASWATSPMPGLTVVSENPVYVQGNYNATSASVTDAGSRGGRGHRRFGDAAVEQLERHPLVHFAD